MKINVCYNIYFDPVKCILDNFDDIYFIDLKNLGYLFAAPCSIINRLLDIVLDPCLRS